MQSWVIFAFFCVLGVVGHRGFTIVLIKNTQENQTSPDLCTFEKYRDSPPISSAMLLQKYALLLAESSIYTTNLYHDAPPICIAMLLQKYWGQGLLEHPQNTEGGDKVQAASTQGSRQVCLCQSQRAPGLKKFNLERQY